MVKKIAVLVSGGGSNLQAIIDQIDQINGEIKIVISNRKNAYGLTRATNFGIETAVISKNDELLIQTLKDLEIDLVVLAGYLAILSDDFIQAFKNKIMNIHPSLIPSFCGHGAYGIHVHEMALQRGVKLTGATVHFVSEIVDGGPIVMQECCDISDLDQASDIQQRVLEIEHRILPKAVQLFCQDKLEVINERVIIK